jgi:hypothetical protein
MRLGLRRRVTSRLSWSCAQRGRPHGHLVHEECTTLNVQGCPAALDANFSQRFLILAGRKTVRIGDGPDSLSLSSVDPELG